MAFESAEVVTSEIHRMLAEHGFHEGPGAREIAQWIEHSKQAWESKRRAAASGRTVISAA